MLSAVIELFSAILPIFTSDPGKLSAEFQKLSAKPILF
jgi:hypothetical protein